MIIFGPVRTWRTKAFKIRGYLDLGPFKNKQVICFMPEPFLKFQYNFSLDVIPKNCNILNANTCKY